MKRLFSDRGSQHATQVCLDALADGDLIGKMDRRGNPYNNAKTKSFMKTLKIEAVYPMAFETFSDVAEHLRHLIEEVYNTRRLHSPPGNLSPRQLEDQHNRQAGKRRPDCCPSLQRRASNMTRKGRCSTLKLLHNFILKSIPI
ncbi:integrase core domain-containing protein [Pararhizobium sp. LjRoot238]|uniref:integrase core domain-containing protein n=1 Tax=Pararhizobium sp. LjRoot238 TaxID=3342293 RepID=UPI003ECFC355